MMRPLTKPERDVLALIYPSTSPASRHTQALKWEIQHKLDKSPQTLAVHFERFTEAGLIQECGGFTKRTKAGDDALIDEPKPSGCEVMTDPKSRPTGFMCRRRG